jgi:tetratricopeptide (TPR) repeat protein
VTLPVAALLLAQAAPVVLKDGTALRASCAADAAIEARLEAGQPLIMRFSVAGEEGLCYKVAAGERTGYLRASEIGGAETYRQALAEAAGGRLPETIRAETGRLKQEILARAPPGDSAGLPAAFALLDASQPRQALEILEREIEQGRRNATVLAVAGVAAWQSDQPRRALEFWNDSLEMQPNDSVAQLAARARQELSYDRSRAQAQARYFTLRFEDQSVSPQSAAEMAAALDEEYARVSATLGCRVAEKITAVVQSAGDYRGSTGAAEWSGGQFDGRIRVPLVYENGRVGPRLRNTFAHEIVHACLARVGRYPAWLHEGLAQYLSGERLSAVQRAGLRAGLRENRVPRLDQLAESWGRFAPERVRLAYELALAGVEALIEDVGEGGLRGVLAAPEALEQLARRLSARLRE